MMIAIALALGGLLGWLLRGLRDTWNRAAGENDGAH